MNERIVFNLFGRIFLLAIVAGALFLQVRGLQDAQIAAKATKSIYISGNASIDPTPPPDFMGWYVMIGVTSIFFVAMLCAFCFSKLDANYGSNSGGSTAAKSPTEYPPFQPSSQPYITVVTDNGVQTRPNLPS